MTTYHFKLPDVGEGIHEAEIVRWLVSLGDAVSLNQPLLEIQTDKAVVEIPAPVAGRIAEIKAEPGALARVGDVIVTIEPDGQESGVRRQEPEDNLRPSALAPGRRVLAAPAVRKLARELGLELARVPGSGPAGRILPGDVRAFAARQAQAEVSAAEPALPQIETADTAAPEIEPLRGLRRSMAERMAESWRTIPHATIFEEIDAGQLVKLRRALQPQAAQRGLKLTYLPFVIKAVTQALRAHPYVNASIDEAQQQIIKHREYHIGVAAATPDGLLVPVVRHADRLTLTELAAEISRLAERAGQRKLSPETLSGGTFTITNFGSFGSRQAAPIINPPEAAILGLGAIADRPAAVNGKVKVRPLLPLALSFDHRLLDGAAAAAFMSDVTHLLADPRRLLLELR
jgi:pyruvate dehydrogenase E2 component (dihydrolipoamide acetyltransferase)